MGNDNEVTHYATCYILFHHTFLEERVFVLGDLADIPLLPGYFEPGMGQALRASIRVDLHFGIAFLWLVVVGLHVNVLVVV